jgi:uncharacterized membrane protein
MINLCNTADCVSGTAAGINNSGTVAGTYFDMNSGMFCFVSSGRAMQRLGTLPGGTYTAALAIGNSGVVAGYGDSVGPDGVARAAARVRESQMRPFPDPGDRLHEQGLSALPTQTAEERSCG